LIARHSWAFSFARSGFPVGRLQFLKQSIEALEVLLHWFITEQVEEEKWSGELMALVEQFHERPGQLFMLDHQWGKRVVTRT